MCAKRIIKLGNVRKVIYRNDYRILDAIGLRAAANIPVFRLEGSDLREVGE